METHIHGRPTIGVLAGWQIYEANVHTFLNLILQGIHFSAQKHGCNLLLACGLGHEIGEVRLPPAFGAIQTIKQTDLRIPQDIAMIGFDDLPG
jgi:DNA-binding LacI/PurR family transcriptional regulator